jgi:hypothetical protein
MPVREVRAIMRAAFIAPWSDRAGTAPERDGRGPPDPVGVVVGHTIVAAITVGDGDIPPPRVLPLAQRSVQPPHTARHVIKPSQSGTGTPTFSRLSAFAKA